MLQKDYDPPRGRLARVFARPPFRDVRGEKGRWTKFSRAQDHKLQHLSLKIDGWPQWSRPLRVVFISDLHTGSHTDDVEKLELIVDNAAQLFPDLVLFGGDYVNMQPFGGGRIPPQITAAILARLRAPLGCYAVLGNHDYIYGADDVAGALKHNGMTVLENACGAIRFEGQSIQIAGIPDAHVVRPECYSVLRGLLTSRTYDCAFPRSGLV